jgi:hypothetical protein
MMFFSGGCDRLRDRIITVELRKDGEDCPNRSCPLSRVPAIV